MRSAKGGQDPAGSTSTASPPGSSDLTARARIRDAAAYRFAVEGFGASVRAIASDAGVSAGLVMHHFGSKAKLRDACDENILATIRRLKREHVAEAAAGQSLMHMFAAAEENAAVLGYVLRSMQDGGPLAREFIDHMVDDAVGYSREGVAAGVIVPSRDEAARAGYLTLSALGALLLEVTLKPPADPSDLASIVRGYLSSSYLPMLELFTEGYLTSRRALEDCLSYMSTPP
ncbi:TetR family transcriptional regulator [Arthrobacter sp. MYb229]|uniref:TetR/AcrR family transcriptional regulator n=1 Tax=unclassified Arthrobacter TaxID=235627 RepID=UPI000CFD2F60|nr:MULTISPECIES: TetR family transcriptional regulator [unclassified Arthrobacter]PRA05930.1 TetR family transcriptional regulator [Arthrobacter sp. MYb229]PRB52832.1 TetR family transcriptional regulator [Arthrobacter sp. MYb216]